MTPDTNVLLRAMLKDDPAQTQAAQDLLANPNGLAVSIASLCELVWVMRRGRKMGRAEAAVIVETVISSVEVRCDLAAANAGLGSLLAGGDFADGVIAHEGRKLGGEVFATFDKKAATLINQAGYRSKLLS